MRLIGNVTARIERMHDIMVDLETLGNTPGSAILSIGAVAFDPQTGEIDDKGMYAVVDVNSCVIAGLRFDKGTLDWWKTQTQEARQVLGQAWKGDALPLQSALALFNTYLGQHGGKRCRVWGNGADFDNALLSAAYKATGVPPGWEFWNSRCFRTLKNLYPEVTVDRVGTYHNALDDARTQAVHALKIFGAMRPREVTVRMELSPAVEAAVASERAVEEDDLVG